MLLHIREEPESDSADNLCRGDPTKICVSTLRNIKTDNLISSRHMLNQSRHEILKLKVPCRQYFTWLLHASHTQALEMSHRETFSLVLASSTHTVSPVYIRHNLQFECPEICLPTLSHSSYF